MTYYKCKYVGNPRNEGRFGNVKEGDVLMLTKEEYDCVAENDDFEFVEEYQELLPNSTPAKQQPKQEVSPSSEDEGEEDEDEYYSMSYSDMKKSELIAEIEDRNEGRDDEDKISFLGVKSELIKRLKKDDSIN